MMSEKIRILLVKRNKSKAWLAEQLGWNKNTIYNKFLRNSFSEKEVFEIAEVLNCTFKPNFVLNDTKEEV